MLGHQTSAFVGADDKIYLRMKPAMTTYKQVGGLKTFVGWREFSTRG
jgi:hypothetical protein